MWVAVPLVGSEDLPWIACFLLDRTLTLVMRKEFEIEVVEATFSKLRFGFVHFFDESTISDDFSGFLDDSLRALKVRSVVKLADESFASLLAAFSTVTLESVMISNVLSFLLETPSTLAVFGADALLSGKVFCGSSSNAEGDSLIASASGIFESFSPRQWKCRFKDGFMSLLDGRNTVRSNIFDVGSGRFNRL
jgi:hypothetical protein